MNIFKKWKKVFYSKKYYDILFLIGVSFFVVILILGLFPPNETGIVAGRFFFIFVVMTIPVVVAIYFILISFSEKFYTRAINIQFSIRKKMIIAFLFLTLLPTILIVIPANNFIHNSLKKILPGEINDSLMVALEMSGEIESGIYEKILKESDVINMKIGSGEFDLNSKFERTLERDILEKRGYSVFYFRYDKSGGINEITSDKADDGIAAGLKYFFEIKGGKMNEIERLNLKGGDYYIKLLKNRDIIIFLMIKLPDDLDSRSALFRQALVNVKKLEYQKIYFSGVAGVFFLALSVMVIGISIITSMILSKNITRPVLSITEAAKEVASGNFSIRLEKRSDDELAVLFESFNQMAFNLENTRKIIYQKQNLEAWREMARRLVHEIKNPLTPIRLSAERMRRRYLENHPEIKEIILSGTQTIVDEVDWLMTLLGEFTVFARLPEMRPLKGNINSVICNCINFFSVHDRIEFASDLSPDIPDILLDEQLLKQAIVNIIKNGIEAIEGSGEIFIKSEYKVKDGSGIVTVRIADNGHGIKDENIQKIFEPGYSGKGSGAGLGLAIVKKIILEHNGNVYCESVYGKGSVFVIELPSVSSGESNGENTVS